jgi:hypothetical protein
MERGSVDEGSLELDEMVERREIQVGSKQIMMNMHFPITPIAKEIEKLRLYLGSIAEAIQIQRES